LAKKKKSQSETTVRWEDMMPTSRRTLLRNSAAAAAVLSLDWTRARAQAETLRIGLIYDLTGPFAAGGSVASSIGAQIAIDLVNEKGGIGGKYKVSPLAADSQSKPDVAINEAKRLINQEKIDIINGVYASSHAVPLAGKVEQHKKILWITTAVATAVFKDKNLQYVFRAQIHSDQYCQAFASFISEHAKAKLGIEPKDVKVALIHEDGPYGVGVATADEAYSKEAGLQVVLKEGYSASAPDLSVLVTKLKRAKADVISHAGYNPDITLLLRQARENGLRFKMLFGAGAGYSQLDKLRAAFGADIDNFCNIDPVPAQLLDPSKLAPGIGDLINTMVARYREKTGATDVPPHCSMGFNQTWVLLNNVLPVAKEKYGSFEPDAVRKAALDVDIPPGGTIQGYGVKFYPPGTPLSGQNERSTPVVMQNAGEHISVVWPSNIRTRDPVFPLPKSSIYAA
jgi:branched-chain amino acid transport system substrate-binding protein